MKKIIILGLMFGLVGCGESKEKSSADNEIRKCVQKGIAYYKEIGSYPMLKSENISAEDKALQKCENSSVAFDSL
ncbi:TPA: hypothetical protein PVK60_000504 [Acinetobacter baumannii]|uniref:Lipoprotein n=2 Tax=Acinetobacter calcoaceticus/baumannii complex TaxID=909768 RepID=A0AB37CXH5_ACINO|nr:MULTISPECIES: hypothetical protein [Acinetobacter calcoaceticus/baumannii complex]EME5683561.1 hypothetical protein [Acinetobacter baumannii]KQF82675.1 hypothetical protein APC22_19915 [Acinetobacter pittii]KQK46427.1 hypothetical protein AQ482_08255 [Acinetobacter baumannii]KRI16133.1 hypothetical protein APC96_07720 [Acinetobacter pittii]KRJ09216.1 hypothetical protein APC76_18885 [Acinetobacter pittii]